MIPNHQHHINILGFHIGSCIYIRYAVSMTPIPTKTLSRNKTHCTFVYRTNLSIIWVSSIQISKVISMAKDNENVQNMTIAFVGSGINTQHQELKRAPLQSLRIRIQANRHASIDNYCSHSSSLDTNLAIEYHKHHLKVRF